jgi:hypothetical protein
MVDGNESYRLAAEYVVQQIRDQLDGEWEDVLAGTRVTVGSMQDCDCIPIDVTDRHGGVWLLDRVERRFLEVTATYEVGVWARPY